MKLYAAALATALAVTSTASVFAQGFSDKDKDFLKETASGNLSEVNLAELALKTSKNAEIRGFAQKMITDHKALYAGEKPVAAKAGVTLPTSASLTEDATYLKLKLLSGETFDKEYVKSMVSDHHDDTTKAKEEYDTTQNPMMKKLAQHAGTVMEGHTKMIDAIAGKMGVQ